MFKKLIFFIIISIFIPALANGAILYFKPDSAQYYQDETFSVQVMINTEEDCINTVKGEIDFSKDVLEPVNFATGNSILTIWLQTPKIDQNLRKISFVGGTPGGYCGPLPGEPGELDLLLKIFFEAKRDGIANLRFSEESQVLLNDGLGTLAKLTTKGAVFTILPEKLEISKNEWQEELEKDNILPESFEIEIHQTPAIFEGKYFIIFSTTDKQTGIDYYEVKEGKKDWKKGESPYLLDDQGLKSIIKVKAIDKAGNERIAEYIPEKPFPYWIIIIIIVGLVIIAWRIRKFLISKS